jgi:lycopene cyclase domain-containing protein
MEKYLYLLLNLLTLSYPLIRSFEHRITYAKKWYGLFPAILITGFLFIVWDHWFTIIGVWEFNPRYILGIYFFDLPLEEWLFFLTVPFACIFIYEVLNYFFPKDYFQKAMKPLVFVLIPVFIILGFIHLDKWYTTVNFFFAALVLFVHYFYFKNTILGKFCFAYMVSLIPFLLVNGILTGSFIEEPVVIYNNSENLSIRIFTIPIEDTVYSFSLLLMNFSIYQYILKSKQFLKGEVTSL